MSIRQLFTKNPMIVLFFVVYCMRYAWHDFFQFVSFSNWKANNKAPAWLLLEACSLFKLSLDLASVSVYVLS